MDVLSDARGALESRYNEMSMAFRSSRPAGRHMHTANLTVTTAVLHSCIDLCKMAHSICALIGAQNNALWSSYIGSQAGGMMKAVMTASCWIKPWDN